MISDELPLSRSTLDRDALIRADADQLLQLWSDPRLRMCAATGFEVAMAGEHLALEPVPAGVRQEFLDALSGGTAPPPGWAYLGRDHHGPVVAAIGADTALNGATWVNLRSVGAILSAREAGLATAAVALANWHSAHPHCSRCGQATLVTASGWERRCPACGAHHFPRTDAAVIMAIVDSFDRILLAHNAMWPENRFSVPAGYVEPGEPLEAAVRREVWEETGIRVGAVAYQGSQPWPFPASLMVGFRGEALNAAPVPDGQEITEARFFSREDLLGAVQAGRVLLPGATSIARSLIEDWFGAALPD